MLEEEAHVLRLDGVYGEARVAEERARVAVAGEHAVGLVVGRALRPARAVVRRVDAHARGPVNPVHVPVPDQAHAHHGVRRLEVVGDPLVGRLVGPPARVVPTVERSPAVGAVPLRRFRARVRVRDQLHEALIARVGPGVTVTAGAAGVAVAAQLLRLLVEPVRATGWGPAGGRRADEHALDERADRDARGALAPVVEPRVLVYALLASEHVPHIDHGRHVPAAEELVEPVTLVRVLLGALGRLGRLGRIGREHARHRRHGRHVPVADVLVEAVHFSEEAAHVRHAGHVPRADGAVALDGEVVIGLQERDRRTQRRPVAPEIVARGGRRGGGHRRGARGGGEYVPVADVDELVDEALLGPRVAAEHVPRVLARELSDLALVGDALGALARGGLVREGAARLGVALVELVVLGGARDEGPEGVGPARDGARRVLALPLDVVVEVPAARGGAFGLVVAAVARHVRGARGPFRVAEAGLGDAGVRHAVLGLLGLHVRLVLHRERAVAAVDVVLEGVVLAAEAERVLAELAALGAGLADHARVGADLAVAFGSFLPEILGVAAPGLLEVQAVVGRAAVVVVVGDAAARVVRLAVLVRLVGVLVLAFLAVLALVLGAVLAVAPVLEAPRAARAARGRRACQMSFIGSERGDD